MGCRALPDPERAGSDAADARVLPIIYRKGNSVKERTWANVVESINEGEVKDFGVRGPRAAGGCLRFLARQ